MNRERLLALPYLGPVDRAYLLLAGNLSEHQTEIQLRGQRLTICDRLGYERAKVDGAIAFAGEQFRNIQMNFD